MDLKLHHATLVRHRKLAGYTVPDLARVLSVTQEHLYRVEWGKARPSPALYMRIKAALHIKDERLLAESHPETAEVA